MTGPDHTDGRQHDYRVGDWVTITGRIVELHPNDVDLGVEVFSKTDQYTAFVRRDLCAPTEKPIPAEPPEGSVALVDSRPGFCLAYQKLADGYWYRAGAHPDDLGITWELLQRTSSDVQVIHHA